MLVCFRASRRHEYPLVMHLHPKCARGRDYTLEFSKMWEPNNKRKDVTAMARECARQHSSGSNPAALLMSDLP